MNWYTLSGLLREGLLAPLEKDFIAVRLTHHTYTYSGVAAGSGLAQARLAILMMH